MKKFTVQIKTPKQTAQFEVTASNITDAMRLARREAIAGGGELAKYVQLAGGSLGWSVNGKSYKLNLNGKF